jgi:hypothetical protein
MTKAKFIVTLEADGKITDEMREPLAKEIKESLEYSARCHGLVSLAAEAVYPEENDEIPGHIGVLTEGIEV